MRNALLLLSLLLLFPSPPSSQAQEPTDAKGYFDRAVKRNENKDYDGALKDYDKALALRSDFAEAYFKRSIIKSIHEDYAGAVADLDKYVSLRPGDAQGYRMRGFIKTVRGDVEGAAADYTRLIEVNPRDVNAYIARAGLRSKKDEAGALADYNRATEITPPSAVAFDARARFFLGKNDFTAALADFNRVIELDPRDADAYHARATLRERLALKEGRTDYYRDVLADLDKAVDAAPRSSNLYGFRGRIRDMAGDQGGALADYTKQIELSEGDATEQGYGYSSRADLYQKMGRHAEQVQDLTSALKLQPERGSYYVELSRAYVKLGKPQESRVALAEAVRLYTEDLRREPDDPYTHMALSGVYTDLGDYAAALKLMDKAVALAPKDTLFILIRADRRKGAGDLEGAAADYGVASEMDPKNAWAYMGRGLIRLTQGRDAEAETDFKRCVALEPKCAAEVEKMVAEIKSKRQAAPTTPRPRSVVSPAAPPRIAGVPAAAKPPPPPPRGPFPDATSAALNIVAQETQQLAGTYDYYASEDMTGTPLGSFIITWT